LGSGVYPYQLRSGPKEYLDLRRQMRDWHGVMDAAADIREIEAKISVLEALEANEG